jgi:hypothetical protein
MLRAVIALFTLASEPFCRALKRRVKREAVIGQTGFVPLPKRRLKFPASGLARDAGD